MNKPLREKQLGQVALETTIAVVAIFVFLLGATQVFIWMNQNIVKRQVAYQKSREDLGKAGSVNFSEPSEFHIFPQEAPGGTN